MIESASTHAGNIAPGARLSEARQAQNLATADIARRLKLSVWQIEALESGRYEQLPGPIFVRGFIRNYARLVKLDPEELLQAAGDSLPQATPHPRVAPSADIPFPTTTRRWPKYAIAAAVIVGLLAVYEFSGNEPEALTTQPAAVASSPPPQAAKPIATRPKAPPAPISTPIAREQPPVSAPEAAPAPAPAPATAQATAPQRIVNPGEREVRLVFDAESWVEIRDRNDQPVFAQLNAAGTARRVSALPPLSVVVGNAHGVRMTYGGQPVDLTRHTKIDVARFTLE